MAKSASSGEKESLSPTQQRQIELELEGFDEQWRWKWAEVCLGFDGGENGFTSIGKLIHEKCSGTFQILSKTGSLHPSWGESKFTRKVITRYIRIIQKTIKKAFVNHFPEPFGS